MNFIETYTGRRFQPLSPSIADIDIKDIAHALSQQCRFSGHTKEPYSVGEHSVRVAEILHRWGCGMETILWGLLHDASEAYLVDLPTPLKTHPDFEFYRKAETGMQSAICRRFGLPEREPDAVRRADAVLLATEARDLMPFRPEHWQRLSERPMVERIIPWSHTTAERNFLERFIEVSP